MDYEAYYQIQANIIMIIKKLQIILLILIIIYYKPHAEICDMRRGRKGERNPAPKTRPNIYFCSTLRWCVDLRVATLRSFVKSRRMCHVIT